MNDIDIFDVDMTLLDGLDVNRRLHSVAVGKFVADVTKQLDLSPSSRVSVCRAALLHDVGYAHSDSRMHALDGARWLDARGVPREITNLVAWHSTARHEYTARGMSLDEVESQFGPRRGDIMDAALFVADFSISPNGTVMFIDDRVADIRRRYRADSAIVVALDAAMSDLDDARSMVASALGGATMRP